MNSIISNKPSVACRLRDIASELLGGYRLAALSMGSNISLSARIKTPSRLSLGRGVTIQRGVIIHCGGKAWSDYRGHVSLANGVTIGPYCVLYGAGGIEIGEFVHLGPGAKLITQGGLHDRRRLSANVSYVIEPITVAEGSWIGSGAVLLPGARIGRCVTVAPNAVVSGVIPDNAVVSGSPGRIVFTNEP